MNEDRKTMITAALAAAESMQFPKCWWWLSFVDTNKRRRSQFLGVCIVEGFAVQDLGDSESNDLAGAVGVVSAVAEAHAQGCNPGGEVQGVPLPDEHVPPEEFRNRLLDKAEAAKAGAY